MPTIDNQYNTINNIVLTEQSVAPSTPPSGKQRFFVSASGVGTVTSSGSVLLNLTNPMTTAGDLIIGGASGTPERLEIGANTYVLTSNGTTAAWAAAGAAYDPTGWVAASETWTYASADAPTFTFTVAADVTTKYTVGMRVKYTQTTVKYGIITAVSAYSAPNTTITIYGGTDYTMTSAAITANSYSAVKAPLSFPLDPNKWQVVFTDVNQQSQGTPTQNAWYNVGSSLISIPIGAWRVSYKCSPYVYSETAIDKKLYVTLSTANNSESDADFTYGMEPYGTAAKTMQGWAYVEKPLLLAAKASYYLNVKTGNASQTQVGLLGSQAKTIIRAVCEYL
jgi:hypothetical protein